MAKEKELRKIEDINKTIDWNLQPSTYGILTYESCKRNTVLTNTPQDQILMKIRVVLLAILFLISLNTFINSLIITVFTLILIGTLVYFARLHLLRPSKAEEETHNPFYIKCVSNFHGSPDDFVSSLLEK